VTEEAKVAYRRLDGYDSTAYVEIDGDHAEGEDKYSDEPVILERGNGTPQWQEVAK
jgi:hypothetical protein